MTDALPSAILGHRGESTLPAAQARVAARPSQPATMSHNDRKLFAAAQELEANYLAEMLKSSGLGKPPETFGGGMGEDQFQSMVVLEHARTLAQAGGIGLAESLFNALKERTK